MTPRRNLTRPTTTRVIGHLRDDRSLSVHDLRPEDYATARQVNLGLSRQSSYLRYFGNLECTADGEIRRILAAGHDRISLVGSIEGRPVALAELDGFDREDGCELALAVDDDVQGQGVGTLLLSELVRRAEARGTLTLRADVLHDNRVMLDLLQRSGLHVAVRSDRDADHVTLDVPRVSHARAALASPAADGSGTFGSGRMSAPAATLEP